MDNLHEEDKKVIIKIQIFLTKYTKFSGTDLLRAMELIKNTEDLIKRTKNCMKEVESMLYKKGMKEEDKQKFTNLERKIEAMRIKYEKIDNLEKINQRFLLTGKFKN